MQVVTDKKLIAQGQKYGKIASAIGLAALVLGLIISFRQMSLLLAYGCLIVGFILSNIGIYLANKWVREPRADQALARVLKGFDDKYTLYNYYLPAQHVLLTPSGLVTFVVKPQSGKIRYDGKRWRHKLGLSRIFRFFAEEGLGDPIKEAQQEAAALKQFLDKHVPDSEVPIYPFVVFSGPDEKLDLEITNPPIPVVRLRDLKTRLRRLDQSGKALPAETRKQLAEAFHEVAEK